MNKAERHGEFCLALFQAVLQTGPRETCYITRMQKDLMRKRVCAMWYDLVRVDKTRLLK